MAFDYDKIKHKQEAGNEWSSYSDLFMVLSLVFLLLYVTATLRGGTFSIQQHAEYQRLAQEAEDLRQQIKVYNTLKEDYLTKGASQQEQELYSDLMDKLKLLKEEARLEKQDLRRQARDNEKKELALNKYQQIVRNIINANLVAQTRIKRRDTIIEEKEDIISKKKNQISRLERDIKAKSIQIKRGERKITQINRELDVSIEKLKEAYQQNEISKKTMEQQIAQLRRRSQVRLGQLKQQKEEIESELAQANIELVDVNTQLEKTQSKLEAKKQESQKLAKELQGISSKYQGQIKELEHQFEQEREKAQKVFQKQLEEQQLSAQAREKRQKEFAQQMKEKEASLNKKVAVLRGKVTETNKRLEKAKELANARRNLAKRIQNSFSKAGVKAEVNAETGDVILSFGEDYFDTGRANLKPGMEQKLRKFMPLYSKSLFQDKKIADKISSVEIIGFASPTYKGKYVDPKSLNSEDRKAVNYNLDLSYSRARSIFTYIFDTDKLKYQNQRRLLPLVKVTGRSFLAEGQVGRDISSGVSQKEFCEKYDCKKSQKVIIKFDLND